MPQTPTGDQRSRQMSNAGERARSPESLGRDPISSPRDGFTAHCLSGWGRFPVERCYLFRPERRAEVARILSSGAQPSYIPHGLGRSYGDAALNRDRGVISLVRLNRFLSFDQADGVLECEAGVSLA